MQVVFGQVLAAFDQESAGLLAVVRDSFAVWLKWFHRIHPGHGFNLATCP
jgi:hypothetical protein